MLVSKYLLFCSIARKTPIQKKLKIINDTIALEEMNNNEAKKMEINSKINKKCKNLSKGTCIAMFG